MGLKKAVKVALRVLSYAKPYKIRFTVLLIISALTAILSLVDPYLIKILIDDVFVNGDLQKLYLIIGIFVGVYLVDLILGAIESYQARYVENNIALDVRSQLFDHLEKLHLGFFRTKKVGDLLSRIDEDVHAVMTLIGVIIFDIFMSFVMFLGILIICLHLSWKVTLASLAVFPFYIIVQKYFGKKVLELEIKIRSKYADIFSFLEEKMSSLKTVKIFGREQFESQRYLSKSKHLIDLDMKEELVINYAEFIVALIGFIPLILILLYGGINVIAGTLTIGALIALYTYISNLFGPVSTLSNVNIEIKQSMASINRVFSILDVQPKVTDAKDAYPLTKPLGDIKFTNVQFHYQKRKPVLRKTNLHIKRGERIGLVGKIGTGKSTIVNLLCRFYDPQRGKITIDGHDIKDVTLDSLRENLGIISQETIMFNTTIRENIRYGHLQASDKDIVKAAKKAGIHESIMSFPQGYDTIVGEKGDILSGGQKQLISIARVLLKDPRIIIFDEATSSLDQESERALQKGLTSVLKNRTAIIIAHKISPDTLKSIDRFIVIDKGAIVESGSFRQLMKRKRVFYKLFKENKICYSSLP